MNLRKVEIFERKNIFDIHLKKYKPEYEKIGIGFFHKWGSDYEEFEDGVGN